MWEVIYEDESKSWMVTRRVGNEFYLLNSCEVAQMLKDALNVVLDITRENVSE